MLRTAAGPSRCPVRNDTPISNGTPTIAPSIAFLWFKNNSDEYGIWGRRKKVFIPEYRGVGGAVGLEEVILRLIYDTESYTTSQIVMKTIMVDFQIFSNNFSTMFLTLTM